MNKQVFAAIKFISVTLPITNNTDETELVNFLKAQNVAASLQLARKK